jgi:hypothetical protein
MSLIDLEGAKIRKKWKPHKKSVSNPTKSRSGGDGVNGEECWDKAISITTAGCFHENVYFCKTNTSPPIALR